MENVFPLFCSTGNITPLRISIYFIGLATTLGTGIYTLITVAAHDHAGPSVVLSILAAAVTACLGGNINNYFISSN